MAIRRNFVLEIAKKKTNKTFMALKHDFKTYFGIILNIFIKIEFNCRFIYYDK